MIYLSLLILIVKSILLVFVNFLIIVGLNRAEKFLFRLIVLIR